MSWTRNGTVSVANGSAVVYGAGTTWASGGKVRAGDVFMLAGVLYEVLSVQSNTQLTLTSAYLGVTASAQSYAILNIGLLPAELAVGISDLQSKYLTTISQLWAWETSTSATVPLTDPATGVTSQVKPIAGLIADIGVARAASGTSNAPAGNITATNVQAAIDELDTKKAPKASPTFTGPITLPQYLNVTQPYGALQVGGVDVMRFGSDTSGQLAGFRNVLINSPFQINNGNAGVPYVSGAALAAGQTGHEGWKAGANGGDYTFTQNPAITPIAISPNKSLIHMIEGGWVEGGTYCISWGGTVKARVGLNAATPSGAYAASPIIITGQLIGVTMSVEFSGEGSGGTLIFPHCEPGSIPTKRELRQDELQRTQRYFELFSMSHSGAAHTNISCSSRFLVAKRVPPTMTRLGNWLTSYEEGTANSTTTIYEHAAYNPTVNAVAVGGVWIANARL